MGEPIPGNVPQNYAENDSNICLKNGVEEGYSGANGATASPVGTVNGSVLDKANTIAPSCSRVYSVSVPVPAIVRAVRTLSSRPFLRRGVESPSTKTKISPSNGGFILRLQLAAISVLKGLLSDEGADYVLRASAVMSADRGDEGGDDMEDSGEG